MSPCESNHLVLDLNKMKQIAGDLKGKLNTAYRRVFTWTPTLTGNAPLRLLMRRNAAHLPEVCQRRSSSIRASSSKKLNKRAGSVMRDALEPLKLTVERVMLHKLLNKTSNPAHNALIRQQNMFRNKFGLSCGASSPVYNKSTFG